MPTELLPSDQAARDRVAIDLTSSLFVEAGAGSGKTTALVKRVVSLITTGTAELETVAAVTFTEKAAAELRDRIRQALQAECDEASAVVAARCQRALDQLDTAAIGTLHSFARRILSEHAIEAGLPPRIEVLDEVSSGIAFERRWSALRTRLFEDEALRRPLQLLSALGVKIDGALRALASAFDDNWDLVQGHVPEHAPEPPPVAGLLRPALGALDGLRALRRHCTEPSDKLCQRLDEIEAYATRLRALDDELDVVEALDPNGVNKPPGFKASHIGRTGSWGGAIGDVRDQLAAAAEQLAVVSDVIGQQSIRRIAPEIRQATLVAANERRSAGAVEFHDLLVLARELLRDPTHGPAVRSRLHQRYRHILLDEFQDTDPIQIEVAVRIAGADPRSLQAGAAMWEDVEVSPGHLFVVGDPKQSIYRFRRADIRVFLAAQRRYGTDGGSLQLTANFRTVQPIIRWVNDTFASLFGAGVDVDTPTVSQPRFLALDAVRTAPPNGPPVAVVGRAEHPAGTKADAVRAAEAADVARTVAEVIDQAWTVADGETWRPARLGDITILVPARTSLPFLEDQLEAAGIPFRAEATSLVYSSRAVRDLLMVLRAVDDPTDHLRIVSALRTPLLGCGDDDLFHYKVERGGSWNYLSSLPAISPPDDLVATGLGYLRRLHDLRQWHAPSELLGLVARDRRAFELGVIERRPRDTWRRLRFVIDQARAWSEATGGGLREYLQWVDRQQLDGARVAEAVLPEPDDDAVRIMTIHAAKGLEFPITIVSGLSTLPQTRPAPAQVVFRPDGEVGYRLGSKVSTTEWKEWEPIDEQMAADERIRLLYVACTRARDHLVVSLHRVARKNGPDENRRTNAELLVAGMEGRLNDLPAGGDTVIEHRRSLDDRVAVELPGYDAWESKLRETLASADQPVAIAATALSEDGVADGSDIDPGLAKRPRDMDLPPWLKGRYGSAVGRAVHGALQTIDLVTGDGLDAAVAAQCEAEAVPTRAGDVRGLVRAALGSPSLREASRYPHWREVYAATPLEDGRLLEGYLDLLYRRPDGLVIVDYKTSGSAKPDDLDERVEGYRWQGQAYVRAIGAATGEPVAAMVFVFLTPAGAIERVLD